MSVQKIEVPASKEVLAEWQSVSADFVGNDDEGMTSQEIAELLGVGMRTTQLKLKEGVASGKYIQGWQYRRDCAGRRARTPVYRVAKKGKK